MRMNTNIPLSVQPVNALAAIDAGNTARFRVNQEQHLNALRPLEIQSAQLGLEQQRSSIALGREQLAEIRRQAQERAAAFKDKDRLKAERDQLARVMNGIEAGDPRAIQYAATTLGIPDTLLRDPNGRVVLREMLAGTDEELVGYSGRLTAARGAKAGYRQVTGRELGMTGPNADRLFNVSPDGQVTNIGGQDAGRSLTVGSDGTVTMTEGGLAGAVMDRANLRSGSGEARIADPNSPTGTAIVAEPGGEAAREQADRDRAAAASAENEQNRANVVMQTTAGIRAALKKDGIFDVMPEVGIVGSRLADWRANQEAVDVAGQIDTLKGMVAFDRLEKMKAASATGASGLGQVTEREIALLAAQLGALDNTLSPKLIERTLDTIDDVFGRLSPEAQSYLLGETEAEPWSSAATGGLDPELQKIFDLYSQPMSP